jgi:nucleotide-binding universal stress UspA family protein
MIAETKAIADVFGAEIVFIHAGTPTPDQAKHFEGLLQKYGFQQGNYKTVFKSGSVNKTVIEVAEAEKVDMLVTGALKKESLRKQYMGSISRKFARKVHDPLMLVPDPKIPPQPIRNIVISIDDDHPETLMESGLLFARTMKGSKLYLVKEARAKSLKHSLAQYYSAKEYEKIESKIIAKETEFIKELLAIHDTTGLDISIEILFGHSGSALIEFANKVNADLIVDSHPNFKISILDRLFPHDIEYLLLNIPCKLLLID